MKLNPCTHRLAARLFFLALTALLSIARLAGETVPPNSSSNHQSKLA
jgi:hypothetical protein